MAVSVQKSKPKEADRRQRCVYRSAAVITVRDLANLMSVSPIEIIKELMSNGMMANINQQLDFDTVSIIGEGMGFEVVALKTAEPEPVKEDLNLPLHSRLIANEDPTHLQVASPGSDGSGARGPRQDNPAGCH